MDRIWKNKEVKKLFSGSSYLTWFPKTDSFNNENMLEHYNPKYFDISYKDKTILDLGAWHGDTAEVFLYLGAKKVIAVEGSTQENYDILAENAKKYYPEKIVPINCTISNPEQIENFIIEYKPDMLKCDIEGAEIHLFNIKNEIWNTVPEYIVECHSDELIMGMREKCRDTNYRIKMEQPIAFYMIYAIRRDLDKIINNTDSSL